jgi:hypothetical protein
MKSIVSLLLISTVLVLFSCGSHGTAHQVSVSDSFDKANKSLEQVHSGIENPQERIFELSERIRALGNDANNNAARFVLNSYDSSVTYLRALYNRLQPDSLRTEDQLPAQLTTKEVSQRAFACLRNLFGECRDQAGPYSKRIDSLQQQIFRGFSNEKMHDIIARANSPEAKTTIITYYISVCANATVLALENLAANN